MFKGSTTMNVGEATLVEAVQEWLDKRVANPQKVVVQAVSADTSSYGNDRRFTITLSENTAGQKEEKQS